MNMSYNYNKEISFDYFLQTMFYQIALEEMEGMTINGLGIIRVDKLTENKYDYCITDWSKDIQLLNDLKAAVFSMIDWFYRKESIELRVKDFHSMYKKSKERRLIE